MGRSVHVTIIAVVAVVIVMIVVTDMSGTSTIKIFAEIPFMIRDPVLSGSKFYSNGHSREDNENQQINHRTCPSRQGEVHDAEPPRK